MKDIPLLKWAGGKRWLIGHAALPRLPEFRRYVEPFVGGGALYFSLRPLRGLLSDLNADLVNLYCIIREQPRELYALMTSHQALHNHNHYYAVRASTPVESVEKAARFLYLNRTCWNGLYRVNQKGMFNVPIGTKNTVLFPKEDFESTSRLLRGADIRCQDFELTMSEATEGDLVFVDPPYTVAHNMNGFVRYNERIFRWSDQIRLRDSALAAANRGAHIVMTNADHPSIRALYQGIGEYHTLTRQTVIAGGKKGRGRTSEALLTINC